MKITATSDLHGSFPETEGGDLLIIAGDCTSNDTPASWVAFFTWFEKQKYRKKILVAGNHDNFLQENPPNENFYEYLCDSGTEFEGVKIWGSPWTRAFYEINPKCKAFTCKSEKELSQKFNLIPLDTMLLVTHSPPMGIFDTVNSWATGKNENVGSCTLLDRVGKIKPIFHFFGHIHAHGGQKQKVNSTQFINASYLNDDYDPVNRPLDLFLDCGK